jgi:hypothetical protein
MPNEKNPKNKSEKPSGKGMRAGELEFEKERAQFRELILANPNYFGNLKKSKFKPKLKIQLNTFYEEIGCVGFQPQFNRLEAVVFVKQPSGYGGGVCSNGTPEFVRFYLSFDDGATWQDQGLTSFTAYDIPKETTGGKQLEYAVTLQVNPPKRFCFFRNLIRARAILSWNVPPPPNDPDFPPVWGSVHDTRIQIDGFKLFILGDYLKAVKINLPAEVSQSIDLTQEVASKPKALGALELQALYKDKKVEPHRFAFTEVQKLISQPAANEKLMAAGLEEVFPGLGIDLGSIVGKFFPTDGDTSYEELDCVGLNPNQDMLVGVIRVKLPNGYSGGPCTAGSKEFVTFWADFDANGTFETCLGTTSVNVYDIGDIPKEGLEYAVFLPVDLSKHRQPCKLGPRVVNIRAILSWQTPPPCNNPNFIPVWGNREETLIQIRPGVGTDAQVPFLSAVGDIPESDVDGNGKGNGVAIHTGFVAADSPFGGRITIAGHISNATPGLKYRVVKKPHGASDLAYVPLANEPAGLDLIINTWDPVNGWVQTHTTVHALAPASDGYYAFEDYSSNHSVEGNIMGVWFSTAAEDGHAFDLRIDLSVDGNPDHDVHSNVVTVLVDNTAPDAQLDIDLGVGVQCADFNLGVTFTGHYTATDLHFRAFQFEIQPSGPPNDPPHGALPVPASGSSVFYGGAIGDPGVTSGTYTLNTGRTPPVGEPHTGPMDACGYALILHVWDRTNVNSGAGSNYSKASVGFCLRGPMH